MPEVCISLLGFKDMSKRQQRRYIKRRLRRAGFDLARPYRSWQAPLEHCVYFWQEADEREEMRHAYRAMMGDPDVVAAREWAERTVCEQVMAAVQDAINRLVAERYPGLPAPVVSIEPELGPSPLAAAYPHWRLLQAIEDALLDRRPPEQPLTIDELRAQLGGDAPPARFTSEGGWKPSEN